MKLTSNDIVERLREPEHRNDWALRRQAADEIERLREENASLRAEAGFSESIKDAEIERMRDERDCLNDWAGDIRIQRDEARAEIERLRASKDKYTTAYEVLRAEIDSRDAEIERLRDQLDARNDIINSWPRQDAEIERLRKRLEYYERETETHKEPGK